MSDTTNASTQTSEEEGKNTAEARGSATQANTKTEAKTFTQEEVDRIVQNRLAEASKRLETKTDQKVSAANAEKDKEIETLLEQRLNAKLAERDLNDKRSALKDEYGLSDEQAKRLAGTTPDELAADAEALFAHLKTRKPPLIRTGTQSQGGTLPSIADLNGKEVLENWDALWKANAPRP